MLHNSVLLLLLLALYHSKPRSIVVLLLVALSTHQVESYCSDCIQITHYLRDYPIPLFSYSLPFLFPSCFNPNSSPQFRDSLRRGLYFYPFGSTAPLPHSLYVALMCAVMLGFRYLIPGRIRTVSRAALYKEV